MCAPNENSLPTIVSVMNVPLQTVGLSYKQHQHHAYLPVSVIYLACIGIHTPLLFRSVDT